MLRKLIADHPPQYIAASFDLAGPTFRSEMATDYKANRAPMPPDLAEQIPWVHEACEALGVPILTSAALRGRRRDRHARRRRPSRPDSRSRSSPATRTSSSWCTTASRSTTRKKTARGSTRTGVKEKFGVTPAQVVDVLALMGDSIDNIKGVPGIGEKGARDLIAHVRLARGAAGACRRGQQQALSRRPAEPRRGCPAEPRAGADPHRRARCRSIPTRCGIAAPRASGASSCSRASASGRWCSSSRRPPTPSARTTRPSSRSTSCARSPTS